eukprot:TRINITY_DN1605_c1_g2_i1.p1 TRINITY_DN1605_c1_g2~~TRINITY_DN1605_c1_g2_i1.p1  ORF type:complete len:773 (-),score=90.32 TRINITY_DN1605_c1_g2_i1:75-2393(-)
MATVSLPPWFLLLVVSIGLICVATASASNDVPILFIAFLSGPKDPPQRAALRQTWLRDRGSKVEYRFFVDATTDRNVLDEQKSHGDLVFMEPDGTTCPVGDGCSFSYGRNLQMLRWYLDHYSITSVNPINPDDRRAPFYVRMDTDVFVCLGNLVHELERVPQHAFLWGQARCPVGQLDEFFFLMSPDVASYLQVSLASSIQHPGPEFKEMSTFGVGSRALVLNSQIQILNDKCRTDYFRSYLQSNQLYVNPKSFNTNKAKHYCTSGGIVAHPIKNSDQIRLMYETIEPGIATYETMDALCAGAGGRCEARQQADVCHAEIMRCDKNSPLILGESAGPCLDLAEFMGKTPTRSSETDDGVDEHELAEATGTSLEDVTAEVTLLEETIDDDSLLEEVQRRKTTPRWDLEPITPLAKVPSSDVYYSEKWAVITTINYPTPAIRKLAGLPGWKVVVVGDLKTPADWHLPNCVYLSVKAQKELGYEISDLLPDNTYAKKNIGYLYAIQHGAKTIYETDDDNELNGDSLIISPPLERNGACFDRPTGSASTVNPYAYFGRPDIWPRGYPLEDVESAQIPDPKTSACESRPLIQQYLADLDPDIDAIFRLTHRKTLGTIRFDKKKSVSIPKGAMCPFNSQNTLFHHDAFWGLLIPITTPFRVCDIWRGYWAQRILWEIGGNLMFGNATVDQVRNDHDYIEDLADEVVLYTMAGKLVEFLMKWENKGPLLFDRIMSLSDEMSVNKFWKDGDVKLTHAWLRDLTRVGYTPPPVNANARVGV